MPPARPRTYEFAPQSLLEVRETLGMSQAKMALRLAVPVNTLSRWEIGATTPSAASLAAIYSVAVENGITPAFFRRLRPEMSDTGARSRLVVAWDYRDVGLAVEDMPFWRGLMKDYLSARFRGTRPSWLLSAYMGPDHAAAEPELETEGFRIWHGNDSPDLDMIGQCRSRTPSPPSWWSWRVTETIRS